MRIRSQYLFLILSVLLLSVITVSAAAQTQPTSFDQVVDRVVTSEQLYVQTLAKYTPIAETYIQNMKPDQELGAVPESDRYFLGRVSTNDGLRDKSFLNDEPGFFRRVYNKITSTMRVDYLPLGFAQMILIDGDGFDRAHYDFKFVRREFLGEVRTIVIDVSPKPKSGKGRFLGRIWVEDQDFNIVRSNGTYVPRPRNGIYLHFDSWRLNMGPGLWLPAYVYSEESDLQTHFKQHLHYKAQTRLWGYNAKNGEMQDEFTQVLVETGDSVRDRSENAQDMSPVASTRAWERQAEDNVLERLQKAGLLAVNGEVDKVLQTVVTNLEVTNNVNLEPELRCRVLLTSPMETFSVGHTIVISRGLLDVLPDEATLAAVLAHEMGHIILGHKFDTRYAFNDRMYFPDERTFRNFDFARSVKDEQDADVKAVELLKNSPYKDKLVSAGLFLRQLDSRSKALPQLIHAHLGNTLLERDRQLRMHELMMASPNLEPKKLDQIAALPLGGRIKVDPWGNKIEISKNKPVALQSPSEKMPFEVTPIFPYLTRLPAPAAKTVAITGAQ